ncbi:MAG: response regulator [Desulfatiglans sp.]|jgi:DNA-binding NtrC family response regulator|nr:response regulator [Desulfatiglans sp.]
MMTRSKKIMVVDDEAGIRALLSDALIQEGYNVTLAVNGADSLRQLDNRRFDLLITDINMPKLNGLELIRMMKKRGRREKVILISGESMDHTRLNKESMPVFAQLKKPFRVDHLLETVISALGSNGSRQKRRKNAA